MNEGYHQLELDEDSRHLITFYGTDCKTCTNSPTEELNGDGHKPSKQHPKNSRTQYQVTLSWDTMKLVRI